MYGGAVVWNWIKSNIFPLIFGYVFVVSGLIVCFLMLVTYLLIWPLNKTLYRKIVVRLVYTHWCRKYIRDFIVIIVVIIIFIF